MAPKELKELETISDEVVVVAAVGPLPMETLLKFRSVAEVRV